MISVDVVKNEWVADAGDRPLANIEGDADDGPGGVTHVWDGLDAQRSCWFEERRLQGLG